MGVLPNVSGFLGWLFVGMVGLGILVNFLPTNEEVSLIETTCRMINLVETKDKFGCNSERYRTHDGNSYVYEKIQTTKLYNFRARKATVSLDYVNSTCRKAILFRSYEDAKSMKFKHSADECKHGQWDTTNFVSRLGPDGQFTCAYHQNRPGRAYLLHPWPVWKMAMVVLMLVVVWYSAPIIWLHFKEPSMEEAIQYLLTNNMAGVKKYFKRKNVNEEMWRNNVVLSPLAIAAQAGNVYIMKYLHKLGADPNYHEDETERGILHFSCQSGKLDAIRWCVEMGLPVNEVTSKNETALVLYIESCSRPSMETIHNLILAGADVNTKDSSGSTALHHACMKTDCGRDTRRKIVEILVKAGCLANNGFGQLNISPLSLLLLQGEEDLCELLVEAGYDTRSDRTLPYILNYLQNVPDTQYSNLTGELENVPPLKRLCRTVIRDSLGTNRIRPNLNLPLPAKLNEFLRLDGIVPENSLDDSESDSE